MKWIVSDFRVFKDGSFKGEYLCTQLTFSQYSEEQEDREKKFNGKYLVTENEEGKAVDEYEKKYNVKIKWQPITLNSGLIYKAYVIQE